MTAGSSGAKMSAVEALEMAQLRPRPARLEDLEQEGAVRETFVGSLGLESCRPIIPICFGILICLKEVERRRRTGTVDPDFTRTLVEGCVATWR